MNLEFLIPPERDGQELLIVLKSGMNLSGTLVKRIKKRGSLTVDGLPAFTNRIVRSGETVHISLPEEATDIPAESGAVEILYEDEFMIALLKPQGMLVHPSRSRYNGTLMNLLLGYLKETGQPAEAHAVTRLDRDTGGIVLFAKNAHVRGRLAQTRMEKTYEALVYGAPEHDNGIIDLPIERSHPESMVRVVRQSGKRAVTHYSLVKSYSVFGEKICVLRFRLETGRTHQIRVHCLAMGMPIIGDTMYSTADSQSISEHIGAQGQQLRAVGLEFLHPMIKKVVQIVIPWNIKIFT